MASVDMSGDQSLEQSRGTDQAAPYDKLNPGLPGVQEPQFLHYSRGLEAPSSTGDLFKNIGTAVTQAVAGVDNFFKARIDREAHEEIDPIRDRAQANLLGGGGSQPIPGEITNAAKGLGVLQQAANTGAITPAYYQMQLDAVAKGLRARYPGYRDHIDQVVSNITGGTPANKIIADLFHAQAQVGANKEQDLQYHLIKELANTDPENKVGSFRQRTGVNPSNDQMLQWVSDLKGKQFAQQARELDFKLRVSQGNVTADEASTAANVSYVTKRSQALLPTGGLYSDNEKLQKMVSELQSNVASGQGMSPDQLSKFTASISQMETKANMILAQTLNDPQYRMMTPAHREALIKDHTQFVDLLKSQLTKDKQLNLDMVSYVGNYLKVVSQGDQKAVLSESEGARWVHAYHGLFGDNTTAGMLQNARSGRIRSELLNMPDLPKRQNELKVSLSKVAMGASTVKGEMEKAILDGNRDPLYHFSLIDGAKKFILDPKFSDIDPKKVADVAKEVYNPTDNIITAKRPGSVTPATPQGVPLIDPAQHRDVFAHQTSPEMTDRFFQLKNQGHTDLWNQYSKYVENTGGYLARRDINEAKMFVDNMRTASLIYDPKNHALTVEAKSYTPKTGELGMPYNESALAETAAQKINQDMQPLIKVMSLGGSTPDQINQKIAQVLAVGGMDIRTMVRPEGEGTLGASNMLTGKPPTKTEQDRIIPSEKAPGQFKLEDRVKASTETEKGTLTETDLRATNTVGGEHLRIVKTKAGTYNIVPKDVSDKEVEKFLSLNHPGFSKGFADLEEAQATLDRVEKLWGGFAEKNSHGRKGKE